MLNVEAALAAILNEVRPLDPEPVPLDAALGLVLAEDVHSDVDSPPFDKSLMDGFAVSTASLGDGTVRLAVIEDIMAGQVPTQPVRSGRATRIMTGAPLPEGADAVVPVELARFDTEQRTVELQAGNIKPGANLMRRGTSLKRGDMVLQAGRLLGPQELGALAEVGQHLVRAQRRPRVAVLATGDELVPVSEMPRPGQIRNSNETMLVAQVRRAGGDPVALGIARDERAHLRGKIQVGLECDVLLLSGGVSAGQLDLVPSELQTAGVRQVFHQVDIKPGKPIWFGVLDPAGAKAGQASQRRYVFGLPGNPVSSLVCFEIFTRTALRRLMGREPAEPQPVRARLEKVHIARSARPTYHPARLQWTPTGPTVQPLPWHGSSDLQATVNANAMALVAAGEGQYKPGDELLVFPWNA